MKYVALLKSKGSVEAKESGSPPASGGDTMMGKLGCRIVELTASTKTANLKQTTEARAIFSSVKNLERGHDHGTTLIAATATTACALHSLKVVDTERVDRTILRLQKTIEQTTLLNSVDARASWQPHIS
mmetsp:Transcript_40785/g.97748  ORF Transcript_40785/g.97748 Transcript_40785/m.97748 type:complete len:129 (-) Transcript_40785:101-487(-)